MQSASPPALDAPKNRAFFMHVIVMDTPLCIMGLVDVQVRWKTMYYYAKVGVFMRNNA